MTGNERGNHQLFINDLCELLEVAKPQPWSDDRDNQYTNEFKVRLTGIDGSASPSTVLDVGAVGRRLLARPTSVCSKGECP